MRSGTIVGGVVLDWSSSAPLVASVDAQGMVTGIAIGEATITAATGGLAATATIEVVEENFVDIALGGGYSCGVLDGGKAVCWGSNYSGYLGAGYEGDGLRLDAQVPPVPVAGDLAFADLGSHLIWHICGTTTDSVAYCWGLDEFTALGAPTSQTCENEISGNRFSCSTEPLRVNTEVEFDWVSAFWDHSCGLTAAGEAYCWGRNNGGVLGVLGNDRESPTAVETNLTFTALAGTAHNTCGVATDGTTYCWGWAGIAAKGEDAVDGPEPVAVPGAPPMQSVVGGRWHLCGLGTDGRAYCWGVNHVAQLGAQSGDTCIVNVPVDCSFMPLEVMGGHSFIALSAGSAFSCGITTTGDAYCWGDPGSGQLGVAPSSVGDAVMNPVKVTGGHSFVAIESGGGHTCAITGAGAVYCWGANGGRQLGFETEGTWSAEPVRLFGLR